MRQARRGWPAVTAGVAAYYYLNGALTSSIEPRMPEIASRLGLDYGWLGLVRAAQAGALILGMLATTRFVGRFGERKVAFAAAIAFCGASVLPAFAGHWSVLVACLFAVGLTNGPLDVTVPALAAEIEQRRKRPMLSFMELWFTFGLVSGGLAGGWAAARIGVGVHLASAAAICILVSMTAAASIARWAQLLDSTAPSDRPPKEGVASPEDALAPPNLRRARQHSPTKALALIAVLAFAALYSDASLNDWTVFLYRELGASQTLQVIGYVCFVSGLGLALAMGRRLVERWGDANVVRAGGAVLTVGVLVAVLSPSLPLVSLGLAAAGLGLGNVHPLAVSAAGRLPGRTRSIAQVNTLSYAGFVLAKPVIGITAAASSLQFALGTCALLGLVVTLVSPVLGRAKEGTDSAAPPEPAHPAAREEDRTAHIPARRLPLPGAIHESLPRISDEELISLLDFDHPLAGRRAQIVRRRPDPDLFLDQWREAVCTVVAGLRIGAIERLEQADEAAARAYAARRFMGWAEGPGVLVLVQADGEEYGLILSDQDLRPLD